jgi:hypothetical protein
MSGVITYLLFIIDDSQCCDRTPSGVITNNPRDALGLELLADDRQAVL